MLSLPAMVKNVYWKISVWINLRHCMIDIYRIYARTRIVQYLSVWLRMEEWLWLLLNGIELLIRLVGKR